MIDSFVRTQQEQERLDLIGSLADSFKPLAQKTDREGGFGYEEIRLLRQSGYTGWTVPVAYGGAGISVYEFVLYQERLAQGDAALALGMGWHLSVVLELAVKQTWPDSVLVPFLRAAAEGSLTNRAASEKATGSPSRGGKMQTMAERRKDGSYILQGRKTFTSLAPVLDTVIVSASLAGEGAQADFLVPMNTPGVSVDPVWDMMGMRGTGSHDLVLDEVVLPQEALVYRQSEENRGAANPYLLHIPACYLGIALAARKEALEFAASYQPNSLDKPILYAPNIGQWISEIDLELAAARNFLYAVAARWDKPVQDPARWMPELGAVKVFAIRTALSVVDKALRIAGAHGLAQSHPLQRMYRDVRFGLHNPPMEDAALRLLHQQAIREMTGE